jgi:pseudaminic acid synthase
MIKIAEKNIGHGYPPFIIAEMSGNHNQSLDRALEIIEIAAKAGVDAIKIQTYTPDTMTLDINEGDFYISDTSSLWAGNSLHKLYGQAFTPWEWHKAIFEKGRDLGVIVFSTPFDSTAVNFLENLNAPCYKISSFENVDLPLIRLVSSTGKPVIISTGMASIAELDEAVQTARDSGCKDLILLKCTSTYPAEVSDTNILTIPHMRKLFNCEVGLSDHTMGLGASVASVALGASVIEKHFTIDRNDGGVDSAFSMEPDEMAQLVIESKRASEALGKISYGPTVTEKKSLRYRRSLYIIKDLKIGDVLTHDNVRAIRPGLGLPTKYLDLILGKKIKQNVKRGTALSWNYLI